MRRAAAAAAAILTLALSLSACETATPYQPLAAGNATSGGFTDQQIEPDRFRVTFSGNSMTPRETVETYLLYHAADLTVRQGYDWFETAQRHTDKDQQAFMTPDPFYGSGYAWGYWRPSWRYERAAGWGAWGPYGGDPFFGPGFGPGADIQTIDKFEASAEIVLHHGPKPAGDPRAFDAHAVIANLGPKIVRPR